MVGWKNTKSEFVAEIISGGRITIPKTARKMLKLKEGSVIKVTLETVEGEPNVGQ